MEDDRRAMPVVRELHPGLPHLLLLGRDRYAKPRRPRNQPRARLGLLLQPRLLVPGGRHCAPDDPLAISTVALSQVRKLEAAVWNLRLHRLRALHYLVPGR